MATWKMPTEARRRHGSTGGERRRWRRGARGATERSRQPPFPSRLKGGLQQRSNQQARHQVSSRASVIYMHRSIPDTCASLGSGEDHAWMRGRIACDARKTVPHGTPQLAVQRAVGRQGPTARTVGHRLPLPDCRRAGLLGLEDRGRCRSAGIRCLARVCSRALRRSSMRRRENAPRRRCLCCAGSGRSTTWAAAAEPARGGVRRQRRRGCGWERERG